MQALRRLRAHLVALMTASGWHRKATDSPAEKQRRADYNSKAHREERARRVAQATPLTPCSCWMSGKRWCNGLPLGPDPKQWHLPHAPDRTYLPGLWRAECNRKEAASRGAKTANARRARPTYTPPPYTAVRAAQAAYRPRDTWT